MDFLRSDAVELDGMRRLPIVHDERFDHYPEFGAALLLAWDVDPGATRARRFYRASGALYEVRLSGNERGFPAEADLAVWLPTYESRDADAIDAGAWTFFAWLLRAAGGEWDAVDPDRFGRRFGVPVE